MFIFYGWGFKTNKVFGTKNDKCGICGNEGQSYVRSRSWFTLFFIPIIPYSTVYLKICNSCRNAFRLEKKQFFQEIETAEKSSEIFSDIFPEENCETTSTTTQLIPDSQINENLR